MDHEALKQEEGLDPLPLLGRQMRQQLVRIQDKMAYEALHGRGDDDASTDNPSGHQ